MSAVAVRPVRPGRAADLQIAGLAPLSTCDWPGKLVATLFLQGCPWSCGYCHNPDLISPRTRGAVPWQDVVALLRARIGLLDGVVFSGGEPTRQHGLADAAQQVRTDGFAVGLHTAGAYPRRLEAVLESVDWVGLDIKALPDDYAALTGAPRSGAAAWLCLAMLLGSGVSHEVRTTVAPGAADAAYRTAAAVREAGVAVYALQQAKATGTRPGSVVEYPGWDEEFAGLAHRVGRLGFDELIVRR